MVFWSLFMLVLSSVEAGTGKDKIDFVSPTVCTLSYKRQFSVFGFKIGAPSGDTENIFCSAVYVSPGLLATANHCALNNKAENIIASCDCDENGCKHHIEIKEIRTNKDLKNHPGDTAILIPKKKPEGLKYSEAADLKVLLSKDGSRLQDDVECHFSGFGISMNRLQSFGDWFKAQSYRVNPMYKECEDKGKCRWILRSDGGQQQIEELAMVHMVSKVALDDVISDHRSVLRDKNFFTTYAIVQQFDYATNWPDYLNNAAPLLLDLACVDSESPFNNIKAHAMPGDSGGPLFCKRKSQKNWMVVGIAAAHSSSMASGSAVSYSSYFEPLPVCSSVNTAQRKPSSKERAISGAHKLIKNNKTRPLTK